MDPLTVGLGIGLVIGVVLLQWQIKPNLVKITQGTVLVRRRPTWLPGGGRTVSFASNYVIKLFDKVEIVDVSTKRLRYDMTGKTKDEQEFSVKAELILQLPREEDNVLVAMEEFGAATLDDPAALKERFEAEFRDAIKAAGAIMEARKLVAGRDEFRDSVLEKLGAYQKGFHADAAFIDLQIK